MTTTVAPVAVAVIPSSGVVTIHPVVVVTIHSVVVAILTAFATVAILSAHRQAGDAEDHQQADHYRSL